MVISFRPDSGIEVGPGSDFFYFFLIGFGRVRVNLTGHPFFMDDRIKIWIQIRNSRWSDQVYLHQDPQPPPLHPLESKVGSNQEGKNKSALRGGKTKFVDFFFHRGIRNKKLGKVKNF